MFSAAASIIFWPANTLPVKLIIPVIGLFESVLPTTVPDPQTKFKTPAGNPIFSISSTNSIMVFGASQLGLITHVLPVINEAATLRAITKNGKFQGQIPTATPIGTLCKYICSFSRSL